jgi:hypothetical protein
MKKFIFSISFFLITFNSLLAQDTSVGSTTYAKRMYQIAISHNRDSLIQALKSKPTVADSMLLKQRNNSLDRKLALYADSLSNYQSGPLPNFIKEICFEHTHEYLWPSIHSPISVRWKILEKVTNRKALIRIINSEEPSLDSICLEKGIDRIPEDGASFKQLITKRLKQLKP